MANKPDISLGADERVVWEGRPDVGHFMRKGLWGTAFGAGWLFILLMVMKGFRSSGGHLPTWVSVLFGTIGILFFLGPLWKKWEAESTRYLLTTERAIIKTKYETRSLAPREMRELRMREFKNGLGDVTLRVDVTEDSDGKNFTPVGFFSIPEPKFVLGRVKELLAGSNLDSAWERTVIDESAAKVKAA